MPAIESRRTSVAEAREALADAESRLADAERDRDRADAGLDIALAERGWRRAGGAFAPEVRLYEHPAQVGLLVPRQEVIESLEYEGRA